MTNKHFDALEKLFDSVEEELGPRCGEKVQEAMCEAREALRTPPGLPAPDWGMERPQNAT